MIANYEGAWTLGMHKFETYRIRHFLFLKSSLKSDIYNRLQMRQIESFDELLAYILLNKTE